MSVLKCSASASSAWLRCLAATRYSIRDRDTSTAIEMPMTAKAQMEASTCTCPEVSRRNDSRMIQAQVASSRSVSTSAERFSTLPCP